MIYREYLVMRKAVAWFATLVFAIIVLGLISKIIHGAAESSASADFDVSVIDVSSGSGWLAAIFASLFGVALGNSSRDAARVLWVIPTQRWKVALQIIAVDLAGTTVAFAFAYALIMFSSNFLNPHPSLEPNDAIGIITAVSMAYATYGWSALVGMLARRISYGGLLASPALMVWTILAQLELSRMSLLRAPIVADPFAVFNAALALDTWTHHHFRLDPVTSSMQWLGTMWAAPVLVMICFGTCGLAAFMWQRADILT